MTEENKNTIRAFVREINARNWPAVRERLADRFVRHSFAAGEPGVRTADELLAFLRAELETFPDARESIVDLIAEHDRVAARHEFVGTQLGPMGPFPASGRRLESTYLAVYRLEGGRIAEAWVEWDNLYSLRRLGHAPAARPIV